MTGRNVTAAAQAAASAHRPFDAVVWDYDGTLVDTRSTDEAAVAALVARDPQAASGVSTFWATEGHPLIERLERSWPGRSAAILELFDGDSEPRLYPGVRHALRSLRSRGMRLGVVSSRRLQPLLRGLERSRLTPLFEVVVGLDTVLAPKPDPEGLLLALRELGTSPARAVFVGDRDVDLEAARRAGTTGWRATWALGGTLEGAPLPVDLATPADVLARIDALSAATG